MRFSNETDAVTYIFTSLAGSGWRVRGLDEVTRDYQPTRLLIETHNLLNTPREYAVVTGSKGKGSTTTLTARILRELGHTVGTITSPHLIGYRERIRINGAAIPSSDFLRLVDFFAPAIDRITRQLPAGKYLSPQGIFLAIALQWFNENRCDAAVIEVGRGGRFDDNALVPNFLSLFSPIVLEHTRYMGPTVSRIAWHKAGILKPHGLGISLPQSDDALEQLKLEAAHCGAGLQVIGPAAIGRYEGDWDGGVKMSLPDGTRIDLPFYGRYEIDNATLAIEAARVLTARIRGSAPVNFPDLAKTALEAAVWPGRCEKLSSAPDIFIDGAVNPLSLRVYLESIESRVVRPVVAIAAVPADRDIASTYRMHAAFADHLILTTSPRNITISFPDQPTALEAARRALDEIGRSIPVEYAPAVAEAIALAQSRAGTGGTVVMAVAQPAIGDAMEYFGRSFEQL